MAEKIGENRPRRTGKTEKKNEHDNDPSARRDAPFNRCRRKSLSPHGPISYWLETTGCNPSMPSRGKLFFSAIITRTIAIFYAAMQR